MNVNKPDASNNVDIALLYLIISCFSKHLTYQLISKQLTYQLLDNQSRSLGNLSPLMVTQQDEVYNVEYCDIFFGRN